MKYIAILFLAVLLSACDTEIKQANRRGMDYMEQKEYRKAIAEFNRITEADPQWYPAYYNRAVSYANNRQFEKALKDFNFIISRFPNHTDAYFNRGILYENMGRYANAIRDYSETIRLQPDFIMAYHYRGIARFRMEDMDGALGDYDMALKLGQHVNMEVNAAKRYGLNSSALFYNKAVLLQKQGQHRQAIEAYSRSIEIDPANARAYYNRAVSKMVLKEKKEALQDLEIASNLGFAPADKVMGLYFSGR